MTTLDYLIKNTNITKNGIASALWAKFLHDSQYETTHRIKRMGPNDKNDLIWMFSKIHGLENIAFLTEEQIELIKDPFTLQWAINNVKKANKAFSSYEDYLEHMNKSLGKFKEEVNNIGLYPSDWQKVLALPFYLNKRK